ncbi:MAG: hypothetical protein AAF483_14945 [Planctomycetota bacterium]
MNSLRLLLISIFCFFVSPHAQAQQRDPVAHWLITPNILLEHKQELKLSPKQIEAIESQARGVGKKTQSLQQEAGGLRAKIDTQLEQVSGDESAILEDLKKLTQLETQMRLIHTQALLQIRKQLDDDQAKLAREIRDQLRAKQQAAPSPQANGQAQKLKQEYQQFQRGLQQLAKSIEGPQRKLQMLQGGMQEFEQFMQQGKLDEAQAHLGEMLRVLGEPEGKAKSRQPIPTGGSSKKATGTDRELAPLPDYSPEELKREYARIYEEDVPWREINWRTCLLEGIAESKAEQKPILLWIFIDRPIDDERC